MVSLHTARKRIKTEVMKLLEPIKEKRNYTQCYFSETGGFENLPERRFVTARPYDIHRDGFFKKGSPTLMVSRPKRLYDIRGSLGLFSPTFCRIALPSSLTDIFIDKSKKGIGDTAASNRLPGSSFPRCL